MNSSTIFVAFSTRDTSAQPTSTSMSTDEQAFHGPPDRLWNPEIIILLIMLVVFFVLGVVDRLRNPEIIILLIMLVVFFVLGVVGNALAFYIYYQKRDKTTSTLFILSLAATDFLTCLIVIPFNITAEILNFWLIYDLVCKSYMFFITFNVPLSAFIMVAVGFDRYFCICHPFLHAMTVRRAKICLVCLTLLACGLGILTALGYGVYYIDTVEEVEVEGGNSSLSSAELSGGSTVTPHAAVEPYWLNSSSGGGAASSWLSASTVVVVGGSSTTEASSAAKESAVRTGSVVNVTTQVIYYGQCVPNTLIVSRPFVDTYQKIYAASFLFSFLIIALLYALIYRSILVRRAWKAKRKRMSCYNSTITAGPETVAEETQLTNINNGNSAAAAVASGGGDAPAGKASTRTSVALRDRMLYANIKTAAMLFVVTVVFVISFLPSWLIGLQVMEMNYILFYIFFFNNVANPFIYAFMNRTFRDDLRQLLKRIKNRLAGW